MTTYAELLATAQADCYDLASKFWCPDNCIIEAMAWVREHSEIDAESFTEFTLRDCKWFLGEIGSRLDARKTKPK